MSEYVTTAHSESNGLWLPLIEYSVRSGISTSTIRRKIKSNTIPFRLVNGKYLIHYDVRETLAMPEITVTEQPSTPLRPKTNPPKVQETVSAQGHDSTALPIMEKAVQMVSEAFEHSLHEKDERIRLLEKRNGELVERLDELKTLVQVLEDTYQVRY